MGGDDDQIAGKRPMQPQNLTHVGLSHRLDKRSDLGHNGKLNLRLAPLDANVVVFGRENAVVDLLASILDPNPDSLGLILGVPSQVGLAKKSGGREEGWGGEKKQKQKKNKKTRDHDSPHRN
jgi:hypothetical protein